MFLKTKALNGASGLGSTVPPSALLTGPRSAGEGKRPTIPSSSSATPISLSAEPQKTGTSVPAFTALRNARPTSSGSSVPLSRYFSVRASSVSAAASVSFSRSPAASALTSSSRRSIPAPESTSATPLRPACLPTGSVTGTHAGPRLLFTASRHLA